MREGAPSADATLLAREVIQNSWDAARELQEECERQGHAAPDFEILFTFRQVPHGRSGFVQQLGLDELAERSRLQNRRLLGLGEIDCLSDLDSDGSLTLLEIRESGTTGMYGPFVGTQSKMFLALVSLGITLKDEGAGGSYGYGKGGLVRGSRIRTVVAYSCFRERADDPGVTRRLMGMTYWGLHEIDGTTFNGFARFGEEESPGDVRPYENERADAVARGLGLDVRDPTVASDLGTTFLLVDPTVLPEDVCTAVERNWWPAIEQRLFEVTIERADGSVLIPRPKKDPVLASFIRAGEVATMSQDSALPWERSPRLHRLRGGGLRGDYAPGRVGLVADLDGWSYPANVEEDDVQHKSLIALVRGPRMVVQYLEVGRARPYVRGVFIADEEVDDLLRQTEPKAHDCWSASTTVDGVDVDAPIVAGIVLQRLKTAADNFRASLKPPVPDRRSVRLPELEQLLSPLISGDGMGHAAPPPPPPPRQVSIHILDQQLEAAGRNRIRLRATVEFALAGRTDGIRQADAHVRLVFKMLEDDRVAKDAHPVEFAAVPKGFTAVEGSTGEFTGRLNRNPARFRLVTAPYHADWTGRLILEGDLVASSDGEP